VYTIYAMLVIVFIAVTLGFIDSLVSPANANITEVSIVNRLSGMLVFVIFSIIISALIQTRKLYKKIAGELEYANKELESFSYSVAHDLRTPISTIKGFSTILIEDYSNRLDQEGTGYLKKIYENADRMTVLTNDLLHLSKVSLHELHIEQVNISDIVASLTDELKKSCPDRFVTIYIEPNLIVNGDHSLLQIALSNLINNAWKYTSKQNNACITFGTAVINKKQTFFIKDNGSGFDMNKASDLFKPFKRLHSNSEFPGTGIGLSIVERVIRKHNGRVWGEGKPGEGATFYFTLQIK
jgi:light-regulated signal transduction histidine kinase (bacteriophytochrome)